MFRRPLQKPSRKYPDSLFRGHYYNQWDHQRGDPTDFDGNYAITAKQGDVLEYSYIGYIKQTRTIGITTKIDEQIFAVDFTADSVFSDGSTSRTDDYKPRLRHEPKNRNNRPGGSGAPARWELLRSDLQALDQDMSGFGWAVPLPELADQANWDPDDFRYDATIVKEYLGYELKFPYFRKNWNLKNSSPRSGHNENYIVFGLGDIYLMAAEAENELNGPSGAYAYVNRVRERAFEPDKTWSGLSQIEFREAMYDERKFELCAEGYRRMDLIRWGILLETVKNVQHRSFNNPGDNIQPYHVPLPIPQSELLLNPNLLNTDPTNNGYRGG